MFRRLNQWYDHLPEPRRFFTFMGCMLIAVTLFNVGRWLHWNPVVILSGYFVMITWALSRVFRWK